MGDGTNDAPALAQADVGVAMNSGTQAAKEAGNMVDLDSDPTKLIEVVEIGKQLLMTRGSLTTFSIANDLAKYFAIVPALFAATLPWLKPLDIMHLHSATSAILSAVIFNAIIIPLLIPIALKGVKYRPVGADALLAPQPAGLGPGRRDRPVHRHQDHRHGPRRPAPGRLNIELNPPKGISMFQHLRACLWLLIVTVVLCCVVYPLVLLGIGKAIFPEQAEGSLIERDGKEVGSRLIAQPFTADEVFQPRPSAARRTTPPPPAPRTGRPTITCSATAWRASSDPIVKYASGDKQGKPVGPDVERWFQEFDDRPEVKRGEKPGIVAQWASLHAAVAQNWIKNDMTGSEYGLNGKYVAEWQKSHKAEVDAEMARLDAWKKANPDKPAPTAKNAWIKAWIAALSDPSAEPKPEDLAVSFFISFSADHPHLFPSAVEHKSADGKTEKVIEPVKDVSDVQSFFFDLWFQAHADVDLEKVPADMVMASGSGLDPHITFENAIWQLDHAIGGAEPEHLSVAAARAKSSGLEISQVREQILKLLDENSSAPLGFLRGRQGLIGVRLVNVLEINLALDEHFAKPAATAK